MSFSAGMQGYFATAGPGSLVGALVGWMVWEANKVACNFASEGCIEKAEVLGLRWTSFAACVTTFAALGGLIGLVAALIMSQRATE